MCLSTHHSPLSGVIEPLQQLDDGALSTAAAADQGQSLSLPHLQVQPLEDGQVSPCRVVELHMLKLNITIKFVLEVEEGEIIIISTLNCV